MKTFLLIVGIYVALSFLYHAVWPTDSTDSSRWKRSGLSIYTDRATGVQYIRAGFGGALTPRLNGDGSIYRAD